MDISKSICCSGGNGRFGRTRREVIGQNSDIRLNGGIGQKPAVRKTLELYHIFEDVG